MLEQSPLELQLQHKVRSIEANQNVQLWKTFIVMFIFIYIFLRPTFNLFYFNSYFISILVSTTNVVFGGFQTFLEGLSVVSSSHQAVEEGITLLIA